MDIFISWSKPRAEELADALRDWLPLVVQTATPWVSGHDIPKGTLWFDRIRESLKVSAAGIVILTPENQEEAWLMYEAGGMIHLADNDEMAMPLLLDLVPGDLRPGHPLTNLNLTSASEPEDLWLLVQRLIEPDLSVPAVRRAFERELDGLLETVHSLSSARPTEVPEPAPESQQIAAMRDDVRRLNRVVESMLTDSFRAIPASVPAAAGPIATASHQAALERRQAAIDLIGPTLANLPIDLSDAAVQYRFTGSDRLDIVIEWDPDRGHSQDDLDSIADQTAQSVQAATGYEVHVLVHDGQRGSGFPRA